MKHVNDNSDNPFDSPLWQPAPCPDVFERLEDAYQINEFLANLHESYPEMQNSPLWQEIIEFAGGRYCDFQDACTAVGGAA